ncbi:amidohydrolase family protein [Oceanobacillus profundus]|uniref:amidohydrolase family protein n=1 Tax=Oceanobacillus TaxID=182709 RepID=UPI0030145FB5
MSNSEAIKKRIAVAGKRTPADTVIKNADILNVFTGEMMDGDIAIVDGYIAGIGSYDGMEVIDASGKTVVPGFIDGHVHIESTMLTPREFSKLSLQHGVTTVITDPHEIANVAGAEGIQFF